MFRSPQDAARCVNFDCEAPAASRSRPSRRPRRIPPALPPDPRAATPNQRRPMIRLPLATSQGCGLALPVSLLRPRTPPSLDVPDAQSSAPTQTTAGCKESRLPSAISTTSMSWMPRKASRARRVFRLPENKVFRRDDFDSRCRCASSTRLGSLPAYPLPCSADSGRRPARPAVPTHRPPPPTRRRGRKNYRSSPTLRHARCRG